MISLVSWIPANTSTYSSYCFSIVIWTGNLVQAMGRGECSGIPFRKPKGAMCPRHAWERPWLEWTAVRQQQDPKTILILAALLWANSQSSSALLKTNISDLLVNSTLSGSNDQNDFTSLLKTFCGFLWRPREARYFQWVIKPFSSRTPTSRSQSFTLWPCFSFSEDTEPFGLNAGPHSDNTSSFLKTPLTKPQHKIFPPLFPSELFKKRLACEHDNRLSFIH